uniref:uncharacterized protein LOC122604028 isoform X2 n=1 Tax=Erigeron canadensis TaxID=72917 RepID=UPI001CB88FB7|nr:uncharacterized protein LOC122604028 isoform X2 [Erigeron canadensis]
MDDDVLMEGIYGEEEEEGIINNNNNNKTNRRKRKGNNSQQNDRNIKGIMLSITKPSYTLKNTGRNVRSLRCQHRSRLRYLLQQLVRRQNWSEASGVLSLLLKATIKDNCLLSNRTKYWAALELLHHMGSAKVKPRRIQQLYDISMRKSYAGTKNKRAFFKGRFDVQLEYLLFCLWQGDTDGAYQVVMSLLQESGFTSDPIANLVVGLAYSHLWYNAIQKEIGLHDSLESSSPIQSMSEPQQSMSHNHSDEQSAVEVLACSSSLQNSNTSIRIDKVFDPEKVVDQDRVVPMEVDYNLKKVPEYEELDMDPAESDQTGNASQFPHTGNKRYGSILYARDLDYMLMPIRQPITNNFEDFISLQRGIQTDHYKAAVKHLRVALHSTPPAFEALLPLIQILLFGDQVKEAIEEVESIVQNSDAALPFRLRASLLEHFSNEGANKLAICFEDALRKDPTCSHSLTKLIKLHHDGYYSVEKLVEMIALHLDATYADSEVWKEFASCFITLSQIDEDRMSTCEKSYGDSYTKCSKNPLDVFKDNLSRKSWKLRCRWWMNRHFTQTILASEIASGNMDLVAYKAASACHLYGPEFVYVVKAHKYLKKKRYQGRPVLKIHMEQAVKFYPA